MVAHLLSGVTRHLRERELGVRAPLGLAAIGVRRRQAPEGLVLRLLPDAAARIRTQLAPNKQLPLILHAPVVQHAHLYRALMHIRMLKGFLF